MRLGNAIVAQILSCTILWSRLVCMYKRVSKGRTSLGKKTYSRSTPCECHFASLCPNLIMYFRVHGTLMAANARTNTRKNMEARNAPRFFSKPASHPDWSSQPTGLSSLLMSKKRLVPGWSMLIRVSSKVSTRNLHEYPFQSKLSFGLQWHLSLSRISSPVGQCVNGTW
jgi:hypothetical protein